VITTPPDPGPSLDASGVQGLQVNREGGSQANFFGGTHHHGVSALEVAWPVLVGRAPLLADAFQHRSGLRDAIEAALDAGARTLVVTGDGGTGKTQLAAAIFERVRGSVDVAVWASVTSREAAVSVYADAFCALHPARARGDATRDAEAFLTWLDSTERSWVVVLDDVGDPADLVGLWPQGPSGRALITTRRLDDAMIGHGRVVINVGLYSAAESMAYLSQRLDRPGGARDVLHEAEQLAEDLGHLPLALAQAAAVIANDAITCASYRTLLADRSRTLAEVLPHDAGDGYPRPLACAWSLAIDRADALPPRGLARPLMSVVAVLDPNGVPESVLLTVAVRSFLTRAAAETQLPPSSGPSEQVPARDVRRALRNLHRLCLTSHDPNCTTRGVRMHALAQRAALERLATPLSPRRRRPLLPP
jgi:hypothetical protein